MRIGAPRYVRRMADFEAFVGRHTDVFHYDVTAKRLSLCTFAIDPAAKHLRRSQRAFQPPNLFGVFNLLNKTAPTIKPSSHPLTETFLGI